MLKEEEISNLSRDELLLILKGIIRKYEVKDTDLQVKKAAISVPVSIFNDKLSSLEVVCKYLIENLNLKHNEVSRLLNRDISTIYQAYRFSQKKLPDKLEIESGLSIPLNVIANRKLATLESIVVYLKEQMNMSYNEIALALKRNMKTVYTVYHRAKLK
jgi:hypothetical protein